MVRKSNSIVTVVECESEEKCSSISGFADDLSEGTFWGAGMPCLSLLLNKTWGSRSYQELPKRESPSWTPGVAL